MARNCWLSGSRGNVAAFRYIKPDDDSNDTRKTIIDAYNIISGSKLWTRESTYSDGKPEIICGERDKIPDILGYRTFDVGENGAIIFGDSAGLTAVASTTGKVEWVNTTRSCLQSTPMPGGAYPVRVIDHNGEAAVDLRTGQTYAEPGAQYVLDQAQGLLVIGYVLQPAAGSDVVTVAPGKPTLEVVDVKTGKQVFQLPASEAQKLGGLTVNGAFDGRVWITTGAGMSVIDARTGETDPDNVNLIQIFQKQGVPLYQGNNWIMLGTYRDHQIQLLWRQSGNFTIADLKNL